jgi:ATP-dependent helicase/nuclease subunit A
LGPLFVDPGARIAYPTLAHDAIARRLRQEYAEEESRILYVAMTRARQSLVMVGSVRQASRHGAGQPGENRAPEQAKSFLDWLAPVITPVISEPQRLPQTKPGAQSPETWLERLSQPLSPQEKESMDYIKRRLEWVYPWKGIEALAAKTSVSTPVLTASLRDLAPEFLRADQPLSAAERGTALHTLLRHLDMFAAPEPEALQRYMGQLEIKNLITLKQRESIDIPALILFLNSGLASRMRKADMIWKEYHFTAPVRAGLLYPSLPAHLAQESIMLQGIIDCFFQEEGKWVLVDYKTDRIWGQEGSLAEKYGNQLNLYAIALERLTQIKVKEKLIYSFTAGKAFAVK